MITTVLAASGDAANVGDAIIRLGVQNLLDAAGLDREDYFVCKHCADTLHRQLPGERRALEDKVLQADMIIGAGTPFLWNLGEGDHRCSSIYWIKPIWKDRIRKVCRDVPVLNLGIGAVQALSAPEAILSEDPECRAFLLWALSVCRLTTVRDPFAQRVYRAMGQDVPLLPCPAFLSARDYPPPPDRHGPIVLNYMEGGGHFRIDDRLDPGRWRATFEAVIKNLRARGERVIFTAHSAQEVHWAERWAADDEIVLLKTAEQALAVYGQARAGLVNRVHAAIPLAGMGRRVILVGADTRLWAAEVCGAAIRTEWDADAEELTRILLASSDRAHWQHEQTGRVREQTQSQYLALISPYLPTPATATRMTAAKAARDQVTSILITRLDGLGDIVLGTSLLMGLHQRWPDARITLVVRPQHSTIAAVLPEWVSVAALPFDPREPLNRVASAIADDLDRLAVRQSPDICILGEYNRVWAAEILAVLVNAERVISFDGPSGLNRTHRDLLEVLAIGDRHLGHETVGTAVATPEPSKYGLLLSELGAGRLPLPVVIVPTEAQVRTAAVWERLGLRPTETVVCFPGSGDGLDKSLDAGQWGAIARHLADRHGRSVLVLGGAHDERTVQAVEAAGLPATARVFQIPAGDFGLLAALLNDSAGYVGTDTGPMHVAAVLDRPTLGVFGGGHWPRFQPVGRRTLALRMPLHCYGCEWLCPFEKRHCIKDIPLDSLLAAVDRLLSGAVDHDPLVPEVIDAPAPDLSAAVVAATMRLHRSWLGLNHKLMEVAGQPGGPPPTESSTPLGERGRALAAINETLAEMTRQNEARDQAIAANNAALAEMTRQNEGRDQAIHALQQQVHQHVQALAAMTGQNEQRDGAIAALQEQVHRHVQSLGAMTLANAERDTAIAHVNEVLAAMTRHNEQRDEAIAALNRALADVSGRLAENTAGSAQRDERQDREILEWRRQITAVQEELANLRRRSVRVPNWLYNRLYRLTGAHGPRGTG
jgi:ADP-heptose:LPS heptosyltransferase